MVDVFISYSRNTRPVVQRLADAVKAEGYSVWWDDELPPHLSYGDVIAAKIGEAKAAIVVWSEDAAQSEWVRAEADLARNQKKLIQTSIDGRMPPMPFNQIQFAEIGDWQGEEDHPGWRKVKASLSVLCGREPAPETAPRMPLPPPPPQPAPAGRSWLMPALLGALVVALLVLGYVLMSRREAAPPPPATNAVAPKAADPLFSLTATVRNGPADIYNDDDAIIGQALTGQGVSTYRQEGEYWRVRLTDGTTGYISRRQLQLAGETAP